MSWDLCFENFYKCEFEDVTRAMIGQNVFVRDVLIGLMTIFLHLFSLDIRGEALKFF